MKFLMCLLAAISISCVDGHANACVKFFHKAPSEAEHMDVIIINATAQAEEQVLPGAYHKFPIAHLQSLHITSHQTYYTWNMDWSIRITSDDLFPLSDEDKCTCIPAESRPGGCTEGGCCVVTLQTYATYTETRSYLHLKARTNRLDEALGIHQFCVCNHEFELVGGAGCTAASGTCAASGSCAAGSSASADTTLCSGAAAGPDCCVAVVAGAACTAASGTCAASGSCAAGTSASADTTLCSGAAAGPDCCVADALTCIGTNICQTTGTGCATGTTLSTTLTCAAGQECCAPAALTCGVGGGMCQAAGSGCMGGTTLSMTLTCAAGEECCEPETCWEHDTDYWGGDIGHNNAIVNAEACQQLCVETANCLYWTFYNVAGTSYGCHMKDFRNTPSTLVGGTSGPRLCSEEEATEIPSTEIPVITVQGQLTCYDDPCDPNASCIPLMEGFQCECEHGYQGDGVGAELCDGCTGCTDIDECAAGYANDCSPFAVCTNTDGGYGCMCGLGFAGDGTYCNDIDECAASPCSINGYCTNFDGSYTCDCNDGYVGDGWSCTDLDECVAGTDDCGNYSYCTNLDGGFTCDCNAGYTGDGWNCEGALSCGDYNCNSVTMYCFLWACYDKRPSGQICLSDNQCTSGNCINWGFNNWGIWQGWKCE